MAENVLELMKKTAVSKQNFTVDPINIIKFFTLNVGKNQFLTFALRHLLIEKEKPVI